MSPTSPSTPTLGTKQVHTSSSSTLCHLFLLQVHFQTKNSFPENVFDRIFFDLNDVGSLDKASIFFTAKKHVVELSFVGLEGKNHKFKIPNLHGEVSTSESSFKAKPNKVVVTLKKVKNEHWPDIKENAKLKKATEKSGDADPSAGLMNIMRDMYNDGDEETKRMIAKAWTESRDKSSRGAGDFV
eukprot:c5992_g1_i2.p1 GENE.c5992_g1_i2~~c5992_g1_i2.p1  ORF type:complete len:185 (+),score=42.34 c5992_g1_i2:307-861(+)